MKLVKLSVLALTFGMFVTSCGNGKGETAPTDTTKKEEVKPAETPAPAPKVDTPVAGAAKADSGKVEKMDKKMDKMDKKMDKMEDKKEDKKKK